MKKEIKDLLNSSLYREERKAYKRLYKTGKVDLSWKEYCKEIAKVCKTYNGTPMDAVEMLEDTILDLS